MHINICVLFIIFSRGRWRSPTSEYHQQTNVWQKNLLPDSLDALQQEHYLTHLILQTFECPAANSAPRFTCQFITDSTL